MRRKRLIILLVVAVLLVGAFVAYQWASRRPHPLAATTASGTIEAEEVFIASEITGRVVELLVDEGDLVQAGQVVARLDDTLISAQLKQAEANREVFAANLRLVQAKTRPEELDQARAAMLQAKANKEGAQKALDNAIGIRNNPQDINARLEAARAEYESINVEGARVAWQNALSQVKEPQEIQTRIDAAQAEYDSINVEGARQTWLDMLAQRDNPQELNQRIAATQAQLSAAAAQVQQARNALNQQYILRDQTCGLRGKDSPECLAAHAGAAATASAVQTALANQDQVKKNLDGLLEQRNNPIVLTMQIDVAKSAFDTALARQAAVRRNLETLRGIRDNPLGLITQADAAKANYDTLVAMKQGALRNLNTLLEMRDNPLTLNAQVDTARAQMEGATAALDAAQARLAQLERGATPEQIDVARVQVAQAQAAAEVLRVQRDKTVLHSPLAGRVNKRSLRLGEMANAGSTVLTIIDHEDIYLTLYIPERETGLIQLGQKVQISVDAFPDQVFPGEVSFISAKAEYTPRNVQTKKERVNLVFAIKVKLTGQGQRLKPGMPADAVILK